MEEGGGVNFVKERKKRGGGRLCEREEEGGGALWYLPLAWFIIPNMFASQRFREENVD